MTVNIDPVLLSLGPIQIRWYGLMYVIGFGCASYWLRKLIREKFFDLNEDNVDQLITFSILGMFIGARTFYVFIYNWDHYSKHLGDILAVWKGGLSFHGALTGMLVVWYFFCKKHKLSYFQLIDAVSIPGAFGIFFGRLGNFINGELYGRVTDVPWGMIFPTGGPYPRHPSQLYEAFFEGAFLLMILLFARKRVKYHGLMGGGFGVGYAIARFGVEFFREADSQLGYYFGNNITMGQILCFFMGLAGVGICLLAMKAKVVNKARLA